MTDDLEERLADALEQRGRVDSTEIQRVLGTVVLPARRSTSGALARLVAAIIVSGIVVTAVALGLSGRGVAGPGPSPSTVMASSGPVAASVTDGTFKLTISVDHATYAAGDQINVETTLTYLGPATELDIYGSGSGLVGFAIQRNDEQPIGGAMDLSCGPHPMVAGKALAIPFAKSAAWDPSDPNSKFIQDYVADPLLHLPAGIWHIYAYFTGYVGPCDMATRHELHTSVAVDVGDGSITQGSGVAATSAPSSRALPDPAPLASDPRYRDCVTAGLPGVLSAFEVAHARDLSHYLPDLAVAPEVRSDDPAVVVVFGGPIHTLVPGASPGPIYDPEATLTPGHYDLCIVVGTASAIHRLGFYGAVRSSISIRLRAVFRHSRSGRSHRRCVGCRLGHSPGSRSSRSRFRSRASSDRVAAMSRRYIASRSAWGIGPGFAIVTRRSTSRSRSRSRIARRPSRSFCRPTARASSARSLSRPTMRRSRASILRRRRRSSATSPGSSATSRSTAEPRRDRLEGEVIAARSLPDDRLQRDVREEVHLPERLAGRRIREVDLDERSLDGQQRVPERDGGVGQPAGIDDDDVEVALVEPVDEGAFVIGLEERDLQPQLGGPGGDPGMDLVERGAAVDLRLARPEEVEVRALEDEDPGHRADPPPAPAAAGSRSSPTTSRTSSSGTSARITTPVPVASTQRRCPPACFLSAPSASITASIGKGSRPWARPRVVSSASTRAATAGGVTSRRTPIRRATRSPYATASPWSRLSYRPAASNA